MSTPLDSFETVSRYTVDADHVEVMCRLLDPMNRHFGGQRATVDQMGGGIFCIDVQAPDGSPFDYALVDLSHDAMTDDRDATVVWRIGLYDASGDPDEELPEVEARGPVDAVAVKLADAIDAEFARRAQ